MKITVELANCLEKRRTLNVHHIFHRYMALEEFLNVLNAAHLINDEFPERDAIVSYGLSMMTQIDELDNDRHMKMQKIEFFEALARAAEGVSLAPPGSLVFLSGIKN